MVRVLAFVVAFGLPTLLMGACGSNSLQPKGGSCFKATDCQAGLFCLLPDAGAGMCSDCTSCVASVPEAGGDTAQPDVMPMDSPVDQVAKDNNVPETGMDTGVQDTGPDSPPPMDGGAG